MNKKIYTVIGVAVITCGIVSGIFYQATHNGLLVASAQTASADASSASADSSSATASTSTVCHSENGVSLTATETKLAMTQGRLTISLKDNSSSVSATIANNTNCEIPMSLLSYKMFDNTLDNQKFFSGTDVHTVKAHTTVTLENSAPSCMSQNDLYWGAGPHQLFDDLRTAPVTLAWTFTQKTSGNSFRDAKGNFCKDIPQLPSIPAPTTNSFCDASHNPSITLSWSDASRGSQGYTIDITDGSNWDTDGGWSISVSSGTLSKTFTSFSGFHAVGGKSGTPSFTSGKTYKAHIYYPATNNRSPEITITIPLTSECQPQIPSIPTPTASAVCTANDSSAEKKPTVTVSWNEANRGSQGYFIDVTDQADFSVGGWSTEITSPTQHSSTFTSFSNFSAFNNATGQPSFTPGKTYHVRIYYPATKEHSSIITFTIPHCQTQTTLNGSCEASPSSAHIDDTVTWFTHPSGGSGTYTYSWTGTDGLSGSTNTITKNYSTSGTKNGHVTISDGSHSITRDCSTNIIPQQTSTLDAYCTVSPSNTYIGHPVSWSVHPSNGSGNYTYSWSGTDELNSSSATVEKYYNYSGTKTGTVTVSDGTQSITKTCSMNVSPDNTPNNLYVSCSASATATQVGSTVSYYANASGGTGMYSYSWDGNDDLNGSSQSINHVYNNLGSKYATVTVYSNGQQSSATCNTYINENHYSNTLNGSCYASTQNTTTGSQIMWYATANGGNNNNNYYYNNNTNYTYSWSGTDNLYGNGTSVYKQYSFPGQKNATVAISDGTQTIYRTCTTTINPVYIPPYVPPTQIGGVYLSQVPYTGSTGTNVTLFILGLMVWSGGVAYFLIRRKAKKDGLTMGQVISTLNPIASLTPAFAAMAPTTFIGATTVSDDSVISALENHARLLHTVVSEDGLKTIAEQSGNDTNAALGTLEQLVAKYEIGKKRAEDWTVLTTEKIQTALF